MKNGNNKPNTYITIYTCELKKKCVDCLYVPLQWQLLDTLVLEDVVLII